MIEIERKFLVTSKAFKAEANQHYIIKQGFLNTNPERTVRVRIKDNEAFMTVKGKSSDNHLSRFEWEKTISIKDAEALLKLCEKGVIDKTRYEVIVGNHTYEIDVFECDNKGLVVAEVELSAEDEAFEKPEWLGKEVTGNVRYYNSQLSKNPYKNWENEL